MTAPVVMTGESAGSPAFEDLSYREIQTKLKNLGLPAKGTDKVLRDRLAEAVANGAVPASEEGLSSSPPTSPKSPAAPLTTRKRRSKQEEKSPKTERYVVTAEVKSQEDSKKQSQQLLSASKAALPDANVKVKRVVKTLTPATPLDRVKKFATDSASKLQDSASKFQKQIKKQKLGSWWLVIGLVALLALLTGGFAASRGSAAWQKQMSQQMESIQGSLESLYQISQQQAAWVGGNVYQGYDYVQNSLSRGSGRISKGASYLWDSGSDYAEGTLEKALKYLPSGKKLRAALPTSACSARLNATIVNALLPQAPQWDGLKLTLKDAWSGLKDDPLKGTGVLFAGRDQLAMQRAAAAIEAAVPADCTGCFLHLRGEDLSGGGNHAAAELQLHLFHHLDKCPNAIVHIQNLVEVHADLLTVLLVALSEQGGLTVDGRTIPTYKALYIGSLVAPASVLDQNDEQQFNVAVKRDLVTQFEIRGGLTQSYIAEVFRRRWDYSAPLQ